MYGQQARRDKFEQRVAATQEPALPTPRYEHDAAIAEIFSELKSRGRALLWLAMTESFDLNPDDERAVAAFMSRVANLRIPDPESRIPDAAAIWSKAKLIQRWEAERRAQRPLDIMPPLEIAGGLVAAGVLLYLSLVR